MKTVAQQMRQILESTNEPEGEWPHNYGLVVWKENQSESEGDKIPWSYIWEHSRHNGVEFFINNVASMTSEIERMFPGKDYMLLNNQTGEIITYKDDDHDALTSSGIYKRPEKIIEPEKDFSEFRNYFDKEYNPK